MYCIYLRLKEFKILYQKMILLIPFGCLEGKISLKKHVFCLCILMTLSKLLIDNTILTIVLDIQVTNCSVFYFLSINTKIDTFCQLWTFSDRRKWRHRSHDIKGLPHKVHLWFWNFLVVWLSFKREVKG